VIILLSVVMAAWGFFGNLVPDRPRRRKWVAFGLTVVVWMPFVIWVAHTDQIPHYRVVMFSGLGGVMAGNVVRLGRYAWKGWASWHD
jgi:hypothetical protein